MAEEAWCYGAVLPPVVLATLARSIRSWKKENYPEILRENLKPSAKNLKLGHIWWYQHYNDSTYEVHIMTKLFRLRFGMAIAKPRPESHWEFWQELKKTVHHWTPSNLDELYSYCQEESMKIPKEYCQKLVDGYHRCLTDVKQAEGHATKY